MLVPRPAYGFELNWSSKNELFVFATGATVKVWNGLPATTAYGPLTEADLVNRQFESAVQLTMFEPPLWAMLRDGRAEMATICAANSMSELVVTPP